jgi:hypothetical protein
MGAPGYFEKRKMKAALEKVGVNSGDLTDQQQMVVNRLLKGELGEDVTVLGLPPEVQKALKQLPSKDKAYEASSTREYGFVYDGLWRRWAAYFD